MRLPPMTTRRWMVVVAALSLAFGACVWASRLKHRRDEFFERAIWHAKQETYYSRLVANAASGSFRGKVQEPPPQSPAEETIILPAGTIERWFGLPEGRSSPAEETDRFRAAKQRAGEMSARGQVLMANYVRRQADYNRRRLQYHTALRRKYVAAAARPWLPIQPDPPKPK
jgi:hypothetical protein